MQADHCPQLVSTLFLYKYILINNSLADEIDEQTHTYTKYIERSVTEATILVTTDSDVATVEIAGEKQTKLLAKTVEIANEITQVDAIVTVPR